MIAAMFSEISGPVHHACHNPRCLNPEHLIPTADMGEHLLLHAREQTGPYRKKR